jgi:myo-inositol-1(or 4)-monophosphatase
LQANESAAHIDTSLARAALRTAVEAAHAAARFIREATAESASLEWEQKGTSDFVTEVDRGAEERIAGVIAAAFPDATLLGEELSPENVLSDDGLVFIADPLDGTTNFLHGYPQYSVSIGVLQGREIIAGAVLNVARGDLFTAYAGGGAFFDGNPVTVSSLATPARALIGTGFPFKDPELLEAYSRQFVEISRRTAGIRRAGSAALDLADLACGRFDGFWELVLAPWDVAAGILLVREAGGIVTDLDGNPATPSHSAVVAGNPDIHPWLLKTLQSVNQ